MICDLLDSDGPVERIADTAIIGGGIAGLVLADRLRRSGKRVIVIESGGMHQRDDTHPLNEVEQLGHRYAGVQEGRARCLGGTSSRWGGAMLPLLPIDMDEDSAGWGASWPVRYADLAPYIDAAERLFSLPSGPFDEAADPGAEFIQRLAKWPTFRRRNVAVLLERGLALDPRFEAWLNATMTETRLSPSRRLESVVARNSAGGCLTVRASEFVIAAGGIESTRLLLLMDREHQGRLFGRQVLGHYFHDHLSAHSARIADPSRAALARLCGFRFENGGMRNLRFETSPNARRAERLPGGYVQVVFSTSSRTPFDALRDTYRAAQRRTLPQARDVRLLARGMPWVMRAAWTRFIGRRLMLPADAQFALNVVIEQQPRWENSITLSGSRYDELGQPLACIDWHVTSTDADVHRRTFELFRRYWDRSGLERVGRLEEIPIDIVERQLETGGGTYHPGGTVRMGRDAADSVVNADLRVHAVPNLQVVSTAAFPTGGAANPTFMLILFALRAADRLAAMRSPLESSRAAA